MGVYIKGMEMPKNCYECYFCTYGYCINLNRYAENSQERDSDCPLVLVPPHGRLIDADALLKTNNPIGKMMVFGGEYVYSQSEIENAPTILEAEGGE